MRCHNSLNLSAILLLISAALDVIAVPTSVLVQNSEVTSNMKATQAAAANNPNNNNNYKNFVNNNSNPKHSNNVTPADNNNKVKRSSSIAKEASVSTTAASAAVDKKSSPEIVPAPFNGPPQPQSPFKNAAEANANANAMLSLPNNGEILNSAIAAGLTAAAIEAAAAATQREYEQQQQQTQLYGDELYGSRAGVAGEAPSLLYKRGITPQQYLYGSGNAMDAVGNYGNLDYYQNPYYAATAQSSAGLANVPNGVWTDEIDPGYVYNDLQDLDDYAPAQRAPSYRSKAYDNLQSLLNSETYLEPVALPLQYAGRYYGAVDADRNKRTSNKYSKMADMRLKRDSKLTPADMLALVALVEAGERARKDNDNDNNAYAMYPAAGSGLAVAEERERERYNPKNYYASAYDYPTAVVDDVDYNAGAWLEPAVVDYYGMPVNIESLPKYELAREHKYGVSNGGHDRLSAKRFMVSKKKKRSLGKLLSNGEGYY